MAIALLPGIASAATYPQLVLTESATSGGAAVTTVAAGTPVYVTATYWSDSSTSVNVTNTSNWTISDPNALLPHCSGSYPSLICTPVTVGTWSIIAVDSTHSNIVAIENITVTPAPATMLDVEMSAFYGTPSTGTPFAEMIGVPDTATVTAYDEAFSTASQPNGNVVTNFADTVRITSTDSTATLPADGKLTKGVGTFSVTFGAAGDFTLKATDLAHPLITGSTEVLVSLGTGSFYTAVTPCRLVDSRKGLGLTGALPANSAQTFVVSGHCGVPVGAVAVTGNLTVTGSTSGWAVYVGPTPLNNPTSSNINFTAGQTRANSLTVGLSDAGKLSATYISTTGNTTDLVFDVTGYYNAAVSTSSAVSNAIEYNDEAGFIAAFTPFRALDTRNNTGHSGKLSAGYPITFDVSAHTPEGCDLVAVTGNVTVTNPTNGWALALTQDSNALPSTSTINFVAGQTVSNGVTIGVSSSGNLHATYISTPGNTTDLVFDVTGYFCTNDGAAYVPIAPSRVLDTRVGNGYSFPVSANIPQAFRVSGRGGVPSRAYGVTGNVTVVNETSGWALFLGPTPQAIAPTSNINFLKGDIVANGMTSAIHPEWPPHSGELGDLNVTYISTNGNTTDVVFDVSGYFEMP